MTPKNTAPALRRLGLPVLVAAFAGALLIGVLATTAGIRMVGDAGAATQAADQPAQEGSRPLKGRIPDGVPLTTSDGRAAAGTPQYIPVYDTSGEMAGYLNYDQFLDARRTEKRRVPVYDDSLDTVVGHFVVDQGFVPLEN